MPDNLFVNGFGLSHAREGMRVKYVDKSRAHYYGYEAEIVRLGPSVENPVVVVRFLPGGPDREDHSFYLWRLMLLTSKIQRNLPAWF